ncbi:FkbM family methyltransferase [Gramella jeungdoensis]|uniref:FkbM family methyltransferase n=1 Tax=Gramella jeungdoensis TaxID=708091 RepID=A0ABT0Z1Q8_9FLAO|nr:FkbM family methyltransferase [Gramella jeungdoensis]MCM8569205.1 FkbM family methyltransferase [Gramella jeungdoensis]
MEGKMIQKIKTSFKQLYITTFCNREDLSNRKISYSQSGEDLIVKFIFDYIGIKKPTYLDIGAHHPFFISNTALFYKNGSRGINIEPDPYLFQKFPIHRKEDTNLNIGIGGTNDLLDFYIISSATLNTFSKNEAERYSTEGNFKIKEIKKIEVRTIGDILKNYANGKFPQFLNIDAEGMEEQIINQIDFISNFPIVICIETISFSTSGKGKKNLTLVKYIEEKGYILYADTNINSIFVKKEFWQKN